MSDELVDETGQEVPLRSLYRTSRERGYSRPIAVLLAPVLWFIIGVMIGELRRREREKARVQREERWRQEVRENE